MTDALTGGDDLPEATAGERPVEKERLLTKREAEVVTLLARGMTGEQIGAELQLSPQTVRTHIRNAMAGVDAHTRAQLVAISLARGEVEL